MQLVNSLNFASLTSIPAIGSTLTNASGLASGVVLKVNGAAVMLAVTADFVIGDVITGTGTVTAVYSQQVMNSADTMLSQYANSPVLDALVQSIIDAINPYMLIDDWYNDVWNIQTAKSYGLAIWGRIVNVSNIIQIPNPSGYAGFGEAGPNVHSFGNGSLYNGIIASSGYVLSDAAFRLLIMAKAAANITNCSIPSLNALLMAMFPGRGKIYVQSLGNMQMTISSNFTLLPFELSILKNSNVFPIPTGVLVNIMPVAHTMTFGEAGIGPAYPTFGFGSFFGGFL